MANPYSPPKSEVGDITAESEQFQPVNLWSVQGRIGRLRYLAYTTGAALIFWLAAVVATFAAGAGVATIIMILGYIALLVFTVMISIQRSHDMDWSGWTILLSIIPLVGFIWVFKAGSRGENTYGYPPPPNTTGVKVLGLMFPIIAAIGIVAAIAIPAYQKYVERTRMAQQAE